MATKRPAGTRPEVVRCPYCGEDYSITYKRCPFCDGKSDSGDSSIDDEQYDGHRSGGKRLSSNSRGGGYGGAEHSPLRIIGTVVSLGLIAAAIGIVILVVSPLVRRGNTLNPSPPATPGISASVSPSPSADPAPSGTGTPAPSVSPSPSIPAEQTATSFTINREDFSMNAAGEVWNLGPAFLPAGSHGILTWSSSAPEVATISDAGIVTAVSPGTTTVTATMAGGYTQECIVRCSWTGGTSSPGGTLAGGTLSASHSDVTLDRSGESFRMSISGTDSTPVWSTSNAAVASVDGSGKVTAAGGGQCTVTASVGGQTFTCIVRCSF